MTYCRLHILDFPFKGVTIQALDSYLDELEWRFNNRENPYLFRDTLLKLIHSDNLPYKNLTSDKN